MSLQLRGHPLPVAADDVIVRLDGHSFAPRNVPLLGQQLLGIAETAGCRLRLDFAGVRYLTGTGLGQLVQLHTALRAAGGRLILVNVPPLVYEIFEITGLIQLLEIHPTNREIEVA
jgi:anti-sigma B factor antagonist